MDDNHLESALVTWGQERFPPPEDLLQRTRSRRYQDLWLAWILGISLILQMITISGGFFLLLFFPMAGSLRLVLFSLLMTLATLPLSLLAFSLPEKDRRHISF